MSEQLTPEEVLRQLGEACQKAGEAIAAALQPLMEAIVEFSRKVMEWARGVYREAGMPYGDTDHGMLRWFRETCEAMRLEREAAQIRERHEMLAEIRSGGWLRLHTG